MTFPYGNLEATASLTRVAGPKPHLIKPLFYNISSRLQQVTSSFCLFLNKQHLTGHQSIDVMLEFPFGMVCFSTNHSKWKFKPFLKPFGCSPSLTIAPKAEG